MVFFTGQTVQVSLWFEYLKQPTDPSRITLESVSPGNAFQIVSIKQSVPLSLTGWGSQSGLVIQLKVPPGAHPGNPSLSVRFSA